MRALPVLEEWSPPENCIVAGVFSNIPEAFATMEVHFTPGSLHNTIGIEIPYREPAQTVGKIEVTTPDEIKAFGRHVGKAVKSPPTDRDSAAQIEDMAGAQTNPLELRQGM